MSEHPERALPELEIEPILPSAPMRCTITEYAVIGIVIVAIIDVIAACAVAIAEGRPPLVLGDVAKVGMGALAGVALGTRRAHT